MTRFLAPLILAATLSIPAHAEEAKQYAQCAGVGDALVEHYSAEAPAEEMNVITSDSHIFFALALDAGDDDEAAAIYMERVSAREAVKRLLKDNDKDALQAPLGFCSELRAQLSADGDFELP